jgi:hypothetical protein
MNLESGEWLWLISESVVAGEVVKLVKNCNLSETFGRGWGGGSCGGDVWSRRHVTPSLRHHLFDERSGLNSDTIGDLSDLFCFCYLDYLVNGQRNRFSANQSKAVITQKTGFDQSQCVFL